MSPEILEIIQRSLDQIEDSLRAPIAAQELADAAGFSLSHYYHVFEAVTGLSLKRYITHRRLIHAAWDMRRGKDAITAALEYGFDTHAGFYKAFRREFGCAPSVYLRTHCAAPPARVNLKENDKMFDQKLLTRALSAWAMENETLTPFHYPNSGHRSESTFSVGSSHCLKASRLLGEMHRQARLQNILAAHGFAAPLIPTLQGGCVHRLDECEFILMQRLEGQCPSALQLLEQPALANALGQGLARLHLALSECDPSLCSPEDFAATLSDWAVPAAKAALAEDGTWLQGYLQRVKSVFPSLPVQIIHRDPNPDNILMHDGQVAAFLDFDLSRIMPRIFDLCYAATGVLSTIFSQADEPRRSAFFPMLKAMADGYHSVSPLTDAERSAIPDMIIAIELTCVAAFAGSDKFARQFASNRDMLGFLRHSDFSMT